MGMRIAPVHLALLAALGLSSALAADLPPSIECNGIYCRESTDRDWHMRIAGEVISPAGVYVAVTGVEGNVIFRGKVPAGTYPPDAPWKVTVPKDGVVGDYLVTIFGTQRDFGAILTPYTDLPFEVYGKTFFHVIPQGDARNKALAAMLPGGLFFQVPAGAEEVTITQGAPWTIHSQDGKVVFDVSKQGKSEAASGNKKIWVGTFKGKPGTTYILGHSLYWFHTKSDLYAAISAERWFVPDPRLQLDPKWWRQTK